MTIDRCQPVRELLPWHASGTLAPAEAAHVRRHLQSCAACRAELPSCHALAAALPAAGGGAAWQPSAAHWSRLLAQVDAESPAASPVERAREGWGSRWARIAAAVAALGAVLLGPLQAPLYQALSDPDAAVAPAAGRLRVAFDTTVDDAAAQALLQAMGARVVQGPSALGLYVVQVDAAAAAAALARLRAHPQVRLAEPLATTGTP